MMKRIIATIFIMCALPIYSQQYTTTFPLSFGRLSFVWPMCDGTKKNIRITSPFAYRNDVIFPNSSGGSAEAVHFALDMIPIVAGTPDTDIISAEDGIVVNCWPAPGTLIPGKSGKTFTGHKSFGGCVEIKHVFAIVNGVEHYVHTFYAHMKYVCVHEGQIVKKGEKIGLMGSTGMSTGPHLHFEMRFNPLDFLPFSLDQIPEIKPQEASATKDAISPKK